MSNDPEKATLLLVHHCYEPTAGKYSIWIIPGAEKGMTDTIAREKGFCLLEPTSDVNACTQLDSNLGKALQILNVDVLHEETADD
jgi:hypothetical protein